MKQYAEYWGQHDVWYQGALRTGRVGVGLVNPGEQLLDYREYKKTAFHNEYLRPMNIDRMMNVCLAAAEPSSGYGPIALSFYRGLGHDAFSKEDVARLSALAPHLAVASHNYWAAQSLRLLARARENALDALTSAVFGIEPCGRVVITNRAGDEILREGRWLKICDGTLIPNPAVLEERSLARTLHQLLGGICFKVVVTDGRTRAQALVSGAPLSAAESGAYPASVAALIWVTPVVPNADAACDLAKLFSLTLAEQRLIARLIAGEDLRDAALALNISLHTARTQLKTVFDKTGLHKQAALLAFAARLSSLQHQAS